MERDERERSLLVVEDDDATRSFLVENLTADGFRVAAATGAGEGLRAIEVRKPDLVVLDLMLGDASGLTLLPIIVVTGRGGDTDRVRGFTRGADDYLVKPFSYPELLWRVRALLRRTDRGPLRGVIRVGDLTIDPVTRAVRLDGLPVHLSAKEFSLLHALAADPTRVFGKAELLRDVWGYLAIGNTRTLDAHACRVRKKLAGASRPFILNVRGVGYRLTERL
jgi:DNA-binding response OmpR family regulator